jgi:hypothetical protein
MQLSLLRLTADLPEAEQQQLKQLIIAFKAQRLARLADAVWDEKGWSQETMDTFLVAHLRTPYNAA